MPALVLLHLLRARVLSQYFHEVSVRISPLYATVVLHSNANYIKPHFREHFPLSHVSDGEFVSH